MRTLYLIRHGQTEWNVEHRMQGHLDSPLTNLGREQVNIHGKTLKNAAQVRNLIVSPSGRTRETANILNSYLGASLRYDDALMERDCGEWSGCTQVEIEADYPRAWKSFSEDGYSQRPPGGENYDDMLERVRTLLDLLYEAEADEIGLVTHGVMSRVILAYYLNLESIETTRVRHPNEVIYRLQFNPRKMEASHFLSGNGPIAGLLHRADSGTILHPGTDTPPPARGTHPPGRDTR